MTGGGTGAGSTITGSPIGRGAGRRMQPETASAVTRRPRRMRRLARMNEARERPLART